MGCRESLQLIRNWIMAADMIVRIASASLRPFVTHTFFTRANVWFAPLLAQLTATNIAHYTGLAILSVHLATALAFSPREIAIVMIATSVGLRFMRLVLAPFADRATPSRLIPLANVISLLGYLGMCFATDVWLVAFCMFAVGTGYGLNGMLVTTLASYANPHANPSAGQKNFSIYVLMNICSNLAAAIAPVIANWLRLDIGAQSPFIFAVAVMALTLTISSRITPDTPSAYRDVRFREAVGPLLRQKQFWLALSMVAAGWAIYTQKYAATPLFVNSFLDRPTLVGLMVTLNSLIILFASLPLTHYIREHGFSPRIVLAVSFALYALAYMLIGFWPSLTILWLALPLWSVAEALLIPQLNSMISEFTQPENRLAGFSLSAVAMGVGEGIGNAVGAALMAITLLNGHAASCYIIFAACALTACYAAFSLTSPASETTQ
jgi:MFS family permease